MFELLQRVFHTDQIKIGYNAVHNITITESKIPLSLSRNFETCFTIIMFQIFIITVDIK